MPGDASESGNVKFILDRSEFERAEKLRELVREIECLRNPDKIKAKVLLSFTRNVFRAGIRKKGVKPARKKFIHSKLLDEYPIVLNRFGCNYQTNFELIYNKDKKKRELILFGPPIIPEVVFETERLIVDFKPEDICYGNFVGWRVKQACHNLGLRFSHSMVESVRSYLIRDLLGFGKIEPLLYDPKIRVVKCEGVNRPVMVEYAGTKHDVLTNIKFSSNKEMELFIKKMVFASKNKLREDQVAVNIKFKNLSLRATLGEGKRSSNFIVKRTYNAG